MTVPQPAFYMLKCEFQAPPNFPKPSCVNSENNRLFDYLAGKLMENGLTQTVIPVRTSCMSRCSLGPVMLVEPGHHMYVGLDEAKIDKIVSSHIIDGEPVKEYLIEDELWAEPISPKDAMRMAGL